MTVVEVDLPNRAAPLAIDDDRWREHRLALRDSAALQPCRLAYAAAHVVMLESYRRVPHTPEQPGDPSDIADHIDWNATMRFRTQLGDHGFGVAESMDTAQRMELGWPSARRLIEETGRLRLVRGFIGGAWTDHAVINEPGDLIDAVIHQGEVIQQAGGMPIIMSMPWLSINACESETYVDVYSRIIDGLDGPVFIHWLGEMFLPSLAGYFPGDSFDRIMALDPSKVRGAKLSLLDDQLEKRHRRTLLARDQILLTGDDYHFADLIRGDSTRAIRSTRIGELDASLGDFSHALLGIFDGIAAPAGLALRLLAKGDIECYREIMTACEALSRIIFEPPTSQYKVGLAFVSWLNGHQDNAMLINHLERARSVDHLLRVAETAAAAGALTDAELAAKRLNSWAVQSG